MADLRWIQDFLDLAETRNFTQTADNRFVTQPTLSRRIQNLEHWLGSTLFDRGSTPIQLTSEGERFVPAARDILRLADKLPKAKPNFGPDQLGQAGGPDSSSAKPETATGKKQPTRHEASAVPDGAAVRIVVVDDSTVSLSVITRTFEQMGYKPNSFNEGREALKSLVETPASILFTDCEMPAFDGYELTEALRNAERKFNRHTPIVALTGHSDLEEINHCFDVGMDDYLCKPVGTDEIDVVINRWLNPGNTVEGIEEAGLASATLEDSFAGDGASALVRTFCETMRERVEEISGLADQGDGANIAARLPSIKSEAFMIGAYSFGRACGQLQRAGAAGDGQAMLEKLGPFLASFVKLERAVRPKS